MNNEKSDYNESLEVFGGLIIFIILIWGLCSIFGLKNIICTILFTIGGFLTLSRSLCLIGIPILCFAYWLY